MTKRLRTRAFGGSLAALALVAGSMAGARGWTPQTSADIRYLAVDPITPADRPTPGGNQAIVPSPDGRFFFFITYGGNHATDRTVSAIHLYRVSDLADRLRQTRPASGQRPYVAPFRVYNFTHDDSNFPPIESVQWQEDSSGILFEAAVRRDSTDIWRIDAATGEARKLLNVGARLTGLPQVRGDTIIYTTLHFRRSPHETCRGAYPAYWFDACRNSSSRTTYIAAAGQSRPLDFRFPAVSPDGRFILGTQQNDAPTLAEYEGRTIIASAPDFTPRPLLRIKPGADIASSIMWSADSNHVVMASVAHPTRPDDPNGYIVDYEVGTGRYTILEPVERAGPRGKVVAAEMQWVEAGRRFVVRHRLGNARGADAGSTYYSYANGRWTASANPGGATRVFAPSNDLVLGGVRVFVDQDRNRPPLVLASMGGREAALLEPDPALAGVERAPVEIFEWTAPDGSRARGGLVLPVHRAPGERLPLVIQAYSFYPNLFLPDGKQSTLDAAQSLAARGFAVLVMDAWSDERRERGQTGRNDVGEGLEYVGRVDSAVEILVQRGVVDPDRVAATGFSRGGMLNLFAIANAGRVRLAATVIEDSFTNSLAGYFVAADLGRGNQFRDEEQFYGGSFWQAKANWLAYDPTLNADRIRTPALFVTNGNDFQVSIDRTIRGAFNRAGRPMDYAYIDAEAAHALMRPAQRIASMELASDWLSYWLKGEMDSDPAKAAQYRRWAPLREQQQRIIEQSRTTERPLPPLPELRTVTFWPERPSAPTATATTAR